MNFFSWNLLHSSALINELLGCVNLFCCICVFQWSDKPCVPHLLQRDSYYVYTQQELKEKLYQEIISYFDKGKVSVGCFVFAWGQRGKWLQHFLHCSSDVCQAEVVQSTQVKVTIPIKTTQASDAICRLMGPQATHTSHQLPINLIIG